jgi:D-specific alpha-keto acid dehydrogenase
VTCTEPAPTPEATPEAIRTTRVTAFGCTRTEAALFERLAPRHGLLATSTSTALTEAAVELAAEAHGVSVGHRTPVSNPTLAALSRVGVRYLSTRSIGTDHVDVDFARSVGITVEGVDYSPHSVADYTLMLILMALRHARSVVVRAAAHDFRLEDVPGRELRDLTVGVVGTGRIGAAVVARLHGFGCRVLTHDARPAPAGVHVPLDELLRRSDVVTLHTPLTADTHQLLDRRRIEQLRPGAIVVNTGRGALLDTDALLSALERGRLGGAALDVVDGEDGVFYADLRGRELPPMLRRLQELPNVVVSPHTAFYTDRAVRDMVEQSLIGCARFDAGCRRG